jgi:hypothetical protein
MPQMAEQHHPHGIGGNNMGRYHSYDNFSTSQHSVAPTPIGLSTSSHTRNNNSGLSTSSHRLSNNNDLNGSSLHSFSSAAPTPIGLNTSLHRHNNNNDLNGSSVHSQQQNGMNPALTQHFTPIGLSASSHHRNNNNDLNGSSVHSQQQNGMNPSIPQHLSGQHTVNGIGMSGPPQFPSAAHVSMQARQQQQQQLSQQQQMGQQQMGQQQMNQQQMKQQQMNQQQMNQHQQQSLDQHSQHSQHPGAPMNRQAMPQSGMNMQGSSHAQGSNNFAGGGGGGGGYTEIDIIQNKLMSLSQSQQSPYHDQFEPRPIDPSLVSIKSPPEQKEDYAEIEPERIVPLPSRREPRTPKTNKRTYKREGSDSSLQVDTIFSAGNNNNVQSSNNQNQNNNTSNHNHKMAESHNLSVMSLSMSEMNHGSTDHYNQQQPHHDPQQQKVPPVIQPEGLTTMFNNSMRFGERRKPAKRSGSNVEDSSVKNLSLDMSVATLGDHMSELGEMSYARMNDSQANMSFSNVFEETERDLYVNGG